MISIDDVVVVVMVVMVVVVGRVLGFRKRMWRARITNDDVEITNVDIK